MYVRPQVHPKLTPFCSTLTGITQLMVDTATSFDKVFGLQAVVCLQIRMMGII